MESMSTILQRIVANRREDPPVDDTPPPCHVCNGFAWLSSGLQRDDKGLFFTREVPCPECIPPQPGPPGFDQWFFDSRYPSLADAYYATQTWLQGNGPPVLVLAAEPGRGKTHLARAAYQDLKSRQQPATWLRDGELTDAIIDSFTDHSTTRWVEQFQRRPNVFLDDFGLSARSEAVEAIFDRFISARDEAATYHGIRTLITTNLAPGDMTDRTSSRLRNHQFVQQITISAPDFRSMPHGQIL